MASGLVNVEGITNKEVEELAQILNELNELIGGEANTGGTATAGTVMAKLNRLLTDLTTTRAGYLDTINTNAARLTNERATKLDNIGATNNTGGTTTAGTVMAKLNKLLTDWTTARAGYLDTINTNIGATGNTGGSASAGTVMAKLNKLLTDWTTARAGKIDTINNAIGTTGNTGGTTTAGTVMAKLNKLLSSVSNGISIKSVQRGVANSTVLWRKGSAPITTRNITISSVNVNKSILIADIDALMLSSYGGKYTLPTLYNSTTLVQQYTEKRIGIGAEDGQTGSEFNSFIWQVIEFY